MSGEFWIGVAAFVALWFHIVREQSKTRGYIDELNLKAEAIFKMVATRAEQRAKKQQPQRPVSAPIAEVSDCKKLLALMDEQRAAAVQADIEEAERSEA